MKKISFIFALIFLFSSCAPATTVVPPAKSPTATIIPTSTHTLTPLPTFTPTLTPTPTLIPRTPITSENAKDIQLLHQISGISGKDIAWSPDGKLLALAGDHEIILFDSDTLQQLSSIPTKLGFFDTYLNIMFSYDGTRILIAGYNRTERHSEGQIFDVGSGTEISKFASFNEVKEFCALGKVLTSFEGRTYYPVFCLPPDKANLVYYGNTLALSPDNVYGAIIHAYVMELARFDDNGSRQPVWDSVYDYPWGDSARSADFSPEGKTLAVGFGGGDIHFYETQSGVERYSLVTGYEITGLSFSPDGTRLAYSSISGSGIIDLRSGYKITEFGGTSPGSISNIAFSPDGRWLATANIAPDFMLWDTQSGVLIHRWDPAAGLKIQPHKIAGGPFCQSWAGHLAFSPDGQHIALTRNSWLQVVELNTYEVLYGRQIEEATSIVFSPDGQFLATGTSFAVGGKDTLPEFTAVQVFRASDGNLLYTLRGIPSARWGQPSDWNYNCVVDMAFTPDSRTLAVADVESIRFFDMQSGEQVWEDFDPKMNDLQDIEISKDGSMLAAIDQGGRAKFWTIKEDKISQNPTRDWYNLRWGHFAFSPDGSIFGFIYYKDNSIVLDFWASKGNDKLFSEVIRNVSSLSNCMLDFSDDGTLLSIGCEDGIISIYGLKP